MGMPSFFMPMKVYLFVIASFLLVACKKSGNVTESPQVKQVTTTMEWLTETNHNFGAFSDQDAKTFDFIYRNVGEKPLVIHEVKTFCPCTSAIYKQEPTMPGDTGSIHVIFHNEGTMPGTFHKHVRVHSNATDSVIELSVRGFYEKP